MPGLGPWKEKLISVLAFAFPANLLGDPCLLQEQRSDYNCEDEKERSSVTRRKQCRLQMFISVSDKGCRIVPPYSGWAR